MKKQHGRVLLITYDDLSLGYDLALKYNMKSHMGFPPRDFMFMNLKHIYYYSNNDVDTADFNDVVASYGLDPNAPNVYNYFKLFEVLCDELKCSTTSRQDVVMLYKNLNGYV